jgi:hypothetical protein
VNILMAFETEVFSGLCLDVSMGIVAGGTVELDRPPVEDPCYAELMGMRDLLQPLHFRVTLVADIRRDCAQVPGQRSA